MLNYLKGIKSSFASLMSKYSPKENKKMKAEQHLTSFQLVNVFNHGLNHFQVSLSQTINNKKWQQLT